MSIAAALILAAAMASAPPPAAQGGGVQLASVEVARDDRQGGCVVRQASGWQQDRDAPAPQIARRGPTVLIEFQ